MGTVMRRMFCADSRVTVALERLPSTTGRCAMAKMSGDCRLRVMRVKDDISLAWRPGTCD
jgi:hypothetical protein